MNECERIKLKQVKHGKGKIIGKDKVCPYCGSSEDVIGGGKYFTQYKGIRQRYICLKCKKSFYLEE